MAADHLEAEATAIDALLALTAKSSKDGRAACSLLGLAIGGELKTQLEFYRKQTHMPNQQH